MQYSSECTQCTLLYYKPVPEPRGPDLVCLSAIDKKSDKNVLNITWYWSSSWARILNVQNILKERTKETSSNISSTCIPSTTIAGADQHSFNTCLRCTSYSGCYAYSPNSGSILGQRRSPLLVQCRSLVYHADPTLIHHLV